MECWKCGGSGYYCWTCGETETACECPETDSPHGRNIGLCEVCEGVSGIWKREAKRDE